MLFVLSFADVLGSGNYISSSKTVGILDSFDLTPAKAAFRELEHKCTLFLASLRSLCLMFIDK